MSGSSLGRDRFDSRLRAALANNNERQKQIVDETLAANDNVLNFSTLADILKKFDAEHLSVDTEQMPGDSPFRHAAFYDLIRTHADAASALRGELQALRDEMKRERGFLRVNFGVFADKNPLGKVSESLRDFDEYCRREGVLFNDNTSHLAAGDRPKTLTQKLLDFRFLFAAVGGIALGASGIDLGNAPPQAVTLLDHARQTLAQTPDIFFGPGLGILAPLFIGSGIFRTFTEHSIVKQSKTLAQFLGLTAIGFGMAYASNLAMNDMILPAVRDYLPAVGQYLPPIDPATLPLPSISEDGGNAYTLMPYLLHIISGATGAALVYKGARNYASGEMAKAATALGRLKNSAAALAFNRVSAPLITGAGKAGLGLEKVMSQVFPRFIDVVGLPAVVTLLSHTIAKGGLDQLAQYNTYYATAFASMAASTAVLSGLYAASGARGRDFGALASAFKEGFCISSSSACLPKENILLEGMGVSEKTRRAVLPMAGAFNMYGTANYLGTTAFFGLNLFQTQATVTQQLKTAGTITYLAMGAPGVASSNIALLDPVMRSTGLPTTNIHQMYAMVLPADRILDMVQTGINVIGDMFPAFFQDRKLIRERNARNAAQTAQAKPS